VDKRQQYAIITIALITIVAVTITTPFATSMSGYQSITGEWYKVDWDGTWYAGTDISKIYPNDISVHEPLSGSSVTWDGNDAAGVAEVWNQPDWNGIVAEIENPKFDRNIDYKQWWMNDTVTENNPEGVARHYEWSIDIYTVNVNWIVLDGIHWYTDVSFWAHFQNNINSVFEVLGAEDAASYVIYAQTEDYTWSPESAGHHIITPTVSNFELFFVDEGTTSPPDYPEEGSDLDFDALTPYSHVAIEFVLADFGCGAGESRPSVTMVLELNVLTVGRFDYALSYVEGGENEEAPIGGLGFFDGIGAALGAGFGALMDGFVGIAGAIVAPLIVIAVIVGCVVVIIIVLRRGRDGQE